MSAIVLRGGDVIDGTGTPRVRADVLIQDERIRHVLPPGTPCEAAADVDVTGLVVSPGFIDMHAHSDLAVLADPRHDAKVGQGITLEVVGQDGLGYAPANDFTMQTIRDQICAWNGDPALDYSWRTVSEYLARIDDGAAVNVATLVPHAAARMMVMGTTPRAATVNELRQIRDIIAQGLHDGALGLSTGLTYAPGMYASDDEITDALQPVSEAGGYYCPHHRNYGSKVIAGYLDCLEIARRAEVALHLTHCCINFPMNKGRAGEVLQAIDRAVDGGLDITLDSYPYLLGASYLASLLPSWAQSGGKQATLAALSDSSSRRDIIRHMEVTGSDGNHGVPVDWNAIIISSTSNSGNQQAIGKSIASIAEECHDGPGDVFADLLIADSLTTGCLVATGNEDNVRAVMVHRRHTVGTDGILVGERPHPRGWGTFPRFIGHYARDLGLMSLEEAVAHATSRAARRLGLTDRGVIKSGAWADLVVFDPDRIESPATYDEPKLPPTGIIHVLVNGQFTLHNGRRTSATPGRAIRK